MVSNHQTIMIRSVMAKLYSTIMEQKTSSWESENHYKRVFDQTRFRRIHLVIYHVVILAYGVIMEKSQL